MSGDGIRPLPSIVGKIEQQARPTDVKRLRSFLGLVNYYTDVLPNMAEQQCHCIGLHKKGTVEMEPRMRKQLPSVVKGTYEQSDYYRLSRLETPLLHRG